jgi:hypothetical protein
VEHWVAVPEQVAHGEVHGSQVGTATVVFKKVPAVQVAQVLVAAKKP